MLAHRVADTRILRLVRGWLRAGVLEGEEWSETTEGTPQGAGITPRTQKVTSIVSDVIRVARRRASTVRRSRWNGDAVAEHDRVIADEYFLDDQSHNASFEDVQGVSRDS